MKKILNNFLIVLSLVFALPAMAAINPNQIQNYNTVFTGKNVIVNGGNELAQINGTTLITPTTGSYPIDNVMLTTSVAGVFQSVQVNSTNVATYTTGYLGSLGATNALRWSVLATNGAPAAGAEFASYYPIEGLNFARFQYGTANAKAGSLQFKVSCTLAGTNTYSGAIKNYANNRSYPFSYSCTAGTDTQVYIQNIPGDTGGTWVGATNAGAAYVAFDLGSGANFKTTANAWATGDYNGVTGTTNLSAQANGSTLTITDVQFEVGAFSTQFERKLFGQVLAECQRYWEESYDYGTPLSTVIIVGRAIIAGIASSSTTINFGTNIPFKVTKRIDPTITFYRASGSGATGDFYGTGVATNSNMTTNTIGQNGFEPSPSALTGMTQYQTYFGYFHWSADSRI